MSQQFAQPPFGDQPLPQFPGQFPKPQSDGSRTVLFVILGAAAVACLCVVGLFAAIVIPAVLAARDAAARSSSRGRLTQIGLALQYYHDTYTTFPAAFTPDANGQPQTSWRTSLLPFMEQQALFGQYDFNVPWNNPGNAAVRQTHLSCYQRPRGSDVGTNRTSYVVVTSQKEASEPRYKQATMFPGGRGTRMGDIADGWANTIAVVEIKNSNIEWCEPRDIDIDSLATDPAAPNSVDLAGGALVVFGDGASRELPRGTSLEALKAMLTRRGGEPVPRF
jgi:hypothetical protein